MTPTRRVADIMTLSGRHASGRHLPGPRIAKYRSKRRHGAWEAITHGEGVVLPVPEPRCDDLEFVSPLRGILAGEPTATAVEDSTVHHVESPHAAAGHGPRLVPD